MTLAVAAGLIVGLPAALPGHCAELSAVVDYRLEVSLFPAEHRLQGTAFIDLSGQHSPVSLRLDPRAEILAVETAGQPLRWTFAGGQLATRDLENKRAGRLTVRYRATFDDPLPTATVGIEDPSFGVRATITEQGAFLAEGIAWFPQVVGIKGRHHLQVAAPEGMIAVAAGHYLGSTTRGDRTVSAWQNDFPLDGLALAAGRLEVARNELDGIQLLTFLSPENAGLAPAYLAAMRRHLAFYRDLLGPYPYAKFAVVENFLPTGYGLPSWTLLGKSVVRLPFLLDTSLPHEIVHSWWGTAIEVDYARGNWAEGLATYLADYLLKERDNPGEALDYRRKLLRDYAALVTPSNDFPLTRFSGRMAKYQQAIGYGKAAMVFHMLRQEVGDQAFRRGLQTMARDGLHRRLGWGDLELYFAQAAGTDLRWFFRQWVEQAGAPSLSLDDVHVEAFDGRWRITGTVVQATSPYRLDLRLRLHVADGKLVEKIVRLDGPRTAFAIDSRAAPQRLEGDPGVDLFRRLDPEELPATVNDLLTPRQPLVIVAAGQEALPAAARDLLRGLHWQDAEVAAEVALDPRKLAGRDLIFLGWPRRAELRPELPEQLVLGGDGLPAGTADALFAVLAGRHSDRGLRALFNAVTPEAARAVAAKISHYGRYSLLLFADGRNLVKTTWSPASSPMIVPLTKEPSP